MAYQHLFSRVPARMSMFRKCDSFDTFARSSELSKEYIQDNLLKSCEYKPSDKELELILGKAMPPVYCACFSKDGKDLIHSRFTFVDSDYTGERPSYLCHSLILEESEQNAVSSSPNAMLFNRNAFTVLLDDFDFNDKTKRPITDCPKVAYPVSSVSGLDKWASHYDEALLKKILFAVLNAAALPQKYVYISLPKALPELSEAALDFYNEIMLVFPYTVRKKMSFISEYNDNIVTKNYKTRFVPSNMSEVFSGRGYVVDIERNLSYGIYEDDMNGVKTEVDFLYRMLFDDEMRNAFISFYEHATADNSANATFNLKLFLDIVCLFRRVSDKFTDEEVIPDDKAILRIFTTYEKYRANLADEERRRIVSVIERYSDTRTAIPQNLFTRIGKAYPTEPQICKKAIITVILDLLHTNLMREKLFSFISSTYASETSESRDVICEDLSRVFYGGFLQSDILDFYSKNFPDETPKTQSVILEKLLMTIRTESIQKKILDFIDKYQETMPAEQKQQVYHTFFEMLPENDALSKRIIPVLGKCMANETDEMRSALFAQLLALIESDSAHGGTQLFEICLTGIRNGLPLGNMLLVKTFGKPENESNLTLCINALLGTTLNSISAALKLVSTVLPELSGVAYERLYDSIAVLLPAVTQKSDLFDILDFDAKLRQSYPEDEESLYSRLYDNIIVFLIGNRLTDAFNINRNKLGLRAVLDYALSNEALKDKPGTAAIASAIDVITLVRENKCEDALSVIMSIPFDAESGKLLSETLKSELGYIDESNNGDIFRDIVVNAVYSYLESGKVSLSAVYSKCLERKRSFDSNRVPTKAGLSEKDIQDNDSHVALLVFGNAVKLCISVNDSDCPDSVKDALFVATDSELDRLAGRVLNTATKKSAELYKEIYDYARRRSFMIARKLELAVTISSTCPKTFKKLFK